jgi:hypothetical protein
MPFLDDVVPRFDPRRERLGAKQDCHSLDDYGRRAEFFFVDSRRRFQRLDDLRSIHDHGNRRKHASAARAARQFFDNGRARAGVTLCFVG